MCHKRHCSAYTLIEVLVAMMILSMSLTVIFRIFAGGLNKISIAADYARAVMVAESVLAAAGNTETLQSGESSGDLFDKYRWVRVVTPYLPDDGQSFDSDVGPIHSQYSPAGRQAVIVVVSQSEVTALAH